jgi:hypothetical protein
MATTGNLSTDPLLYIKALEGHPEVAISHNEQITELIGYEMAAH